jgi:hypothetical protein
MKRSFPILATTILIPFTVWPAHAAPPANLNSRLDAFFQALPHASFEWSAAKGVSDRAAMRLPADLDGTKGWLQFDTGLDVTLVYGDLPAERKWETHDGMYHVPRVRIGDMDLGPAWLRGRVDADTKGKRLGSLGLDLLVGKWVLIDYPGRRIAFMNPGDAPLWLLQRATWTPAELRDAKFFLTVVLGGKTVGGIFFDTGASAFDITVDYKKWTELTGITDPDSATTRWTVSSWGSQLTALGAPAKGPLVIGSARLPDPRVFYLKEQPELFTQWPFPATGLVGNAPFWDRVVILDLGLRPRFGLVQ